MKIFFTPDHTKHNPEAELHRGALVPPHEGPHRMDILQIGLKRAGFTDFATPPGADLSAITAVHRPDYIDFLQTAWARWQDAGYSGDVLPMSYPYTTRRKVPPKDIDGAAGYYCSSSDTPITRTTWQAAKSVAECALAASAYTSRTGQPSFTLTRPPGHHAGIAYMAGYCFLNNAAIAAQNLRKLGAKKVAILDVDFHHGNGTQDIFYARDDVLFVSLHGEPDQAKDLTLISPCRLARFTKRGTTPYGLGLTASKNSERTHSSFRSVSTHLNMTRLAVLN